MKRAAIAILMMAGATAAVPAAPAGAEEAYGYRLGAGDRLRITTYDEAQLTGEFPVNGEGVVAFPLVGDVPAKGRTIADFRADLIDRLRRGFLKRPSVTVEVANFRPVSVLGEVSKPGQFPYTENMSVFGLVSLAGGFTYRANQHRVFIRHEDEPNEQRITLDSNTRVRPGDTIRIAQRYF